MLGDSQHHSQAAWACVQINEEGHVIKTLRGVVPWGFEQSASAGEHLAWYMAASKARGVITIVCDNQVVVDDANKGVTLSSAACKPFGGVWKAAESDGLVHRVRWTRKVKSHQSEAAVRDLVEKGEKTAQDLRDVRGNARADEQAAIAREGHGYTDEDVKDIEAHRARSKCVLKVRARMLGQWRGTREL